MSKRLHLFGMMDRSKITVVLLLLCFACVSTLTPKKTDVTTKKTDVTTKKADVTTKKTDVTTKKTDVTTDIYEDEEYDDDYENETMVETMTKKADASAGLVTPAVTDHKVNGLFQSIPGYGGLKQESCAGNKCGEALYLTPYIKANNIETGVRMAKVTGHPLLDSIRSYSGYLTINDSAKSNTFFWFIPAMDSETSSPLIIWLQGGPGQSGLFGLFNLHGPLEINNTEVFRRKYTWAASLNMLYLDNPFGVGFSYTEDKNGYVHTQEQAANNLFIALNQFFQLFPDYRDDHIYISGEGYGAKFAISLAHKIHEMGKDSIFNLKGIILENPKIEQDNFMEQGEYFYEMGLIDDQELYHVNERLHQASGQIHHYTWADAMNHVEHVFGSPYEKPIDKKAYMPELTGFSDILNIIEPEEPEHFQKYLEFVNQPEVRAALHVGSQPFWDGKEAYHALREDIPQSVRIWLASLLDNYRTLFYGGNLNAKVPYSMAVDILHKIHWRHYPEYKNATRMIWKVDRQDLDVAGYVHHVKNFFEVMVRNAGHLVAYDQPRATLDMINRFIWGRAFNVNQKQ